MSAAVMWRRAAGLLAVAVLVAACGQEAERSDPPSASPSTAPPSSVPDVAPTLPPTTLPPTTAAPTTAAPTTAPRPAPAATAPPTTLAAPGAAVASVIDGDTIELVGGAGVRLIGIDTPERGECGFGEASATLRSLIAGRPVRLVPGARDDRDRYGRLLRYVEVDGVDLNLWMINSGRAIARYDSRDGYGRHARENEYVAADRQSPSANVCGPPTTLAPSAPGAGGLDPRFGSCREALANGFGPYVAGIDPEYGWYRDGDGDGTVCE
jgi:endonuclease YncB( thermonuclease family)